MGVKKPRVGLLSNGEEESKGNELVKTTHTLFKQVSSDIGFSFVGNVEGRDVFRGEADVVVCDGFVGNVLLKTGEGVAEMMLQLIRAEFGGDLWKKPFVLPLRPSLQRVRNRLAYEESSGAPPLSS